MDGADFALEALPACLMASLTGAVFGDCIWHPASLLGNSRMWFPGGDPPGGVVSHAFGMGAIAFAPAAGLLGGAATHMLVAAMKSLHRPFHRLKHGNGQRRRWRCAVVLAAVGSANGALAMVYPSAQWWGEEQLQVVLTRGCAAVHNLTTCQPFDLPHWYPGLASSVAIQATPGHPMSVLAMVGLGCMKLLMISLCEAGGFIGGAIYPAIFMAGSLGSALGALPAIESLGGQFVYLSTAASMSVALAALLNTHLFGVLLVVVLQANIPHGTTSSQIIALMMAVFVHYALTRKLVTPCLNLIAPQKPRSDLTYLETEQLCQELPTSRSPSDSEVLPTSDSRSDSEVSSAASGSEDECSVSEV